jgi:hypothetical protein
MAHDTKRRILLRALAIVGDRQDLTLQLRARRWLSGFTEPPDEVFLRAVDIVLEHDGIAFPMIPAKTTRHGGTSH